MKKNIFSETIKISKEQRSKLKKQKSFVLWFTGLSGSGKSTISNALDEYLYNMGLHTYVLDGDNVRLGINNDLSFDENSRNENIRRISEIAKLFVDAGIITIVSAITPLIKNRDEAKEKVSKNEFIEIFVNTPLAICEQRDKKGLYKKAKNGEIKNFTGISSTYEKPLNPDIELKGYDCSIEENVKTIISFLKNKNYLK
ncbi:adenylyl-sulfate kinase [Arcobacter sp. CECT 8986]|uniref:adenylyl-sulfate kinase n=1 Tax=Arcobacter sp. CECT 8986 TaxID=2044507 RepID=UPI0035C26A70